MRRDGWPFFAYDPARPVVLRTGARGSVADYTVFWHTELTTDSTCTGMSFGHCLVRELARGRDDLVGAPAEALGVARWLGATRAIAGLPDLDRLKSAPIRITAIGHFARAGADSITNAGSIKFLSALDVVMVDPARLRVPSGYRATARQPK